MQQLVTCGRYLAQADGSPFFWLGDTAWELFHRCDRKDAEDYLDARARQGFTVIQAVALAEQEGLTVPNRYGRLPFLFTDGMPDPLRPDLEGSYSYWDHVDFILEAAEARGLRVALLPTWGDKFNKAWGKGPEIFDPENARLYAAWLARRTADRTNILWMLGGDRPLETPEHRAVVDAMAAGIREGGSEGLITFHPMGPRSSVEFVLDAPWIQIHTAQTGHGIEYSGGSDAMMRAMAAASPRPYLDSEPRYEDHPACFEPKLGYYWSADECRQDLYWCLMAGACGHTYGNHCIWSMNDTASDYFPFPWREVLCHPGAEQMHHAAGLRFRRDYFSFRPAQELLLNQYPGPGHLAAGIGDGYAYLYSPLGLPIQADPAPLKAVRLRLLWFDPRTGEETLAGILSGSEPATLVPPAQGKGRDYVVVLEKA